MTEPTAARDRVIVALDLERAPALELAATLQGRARWLKVGMTSFYQAGPTIVAELRGMGFEVFLDLKLHDIPHQARGAARSVASLGAQMITVHASGGSEMIEAAVLGAHEGARAAGCMPPAILAVTVLTSIDAATLVSVGVDRAPADQVALLAVVARDAGADGVVCSPQEASAVRRTLGGEALVVTPGVRPAGADVGDQSRTATPAQALRSGASHLVIGRPITADPDPASAFERIVKEIEGAAR
jgi:orotidine-5'-phosphate decarboxylase